MSSYQTVNKDVARMWQWFTTYTPVQFLFVGRFQGEYQRSHSDDYLGNCVSNLVSYISVICEARLKYKLWNWKQKEQIEVSCDNHGGVSL